MITNNIFSDMYWQEHTGQSFEEDVPNFCFSSEFPEEMKKL